MVVTSNSISMFPVQTPVSSQTSTLCHLLALVGDSAANITVMMVRMTSPIAWRWIGLKLMVVAVVPQHCTQSPELVQVRATTGDADRLTVLEVQLFICESSMAAMASFTSPEIASRSMEIR
jgi:hypothetical protein